MQNNIDDFDSFLGNYDACRTMGFDGVGGNELSCFNGNTKKTCAITFECCEYIRVVRITFSIFP